MKEWQKDAKAKLGKEEWKEEKGHYDTNGWAVVPIVRTTDVMAKGDYYLIGVAEDASKPLAE